MPHNRLCSRTPLTCAGRWLLAVVRSVASQCVVQALLHHGLTAARLLLRRPLILRAKGTAGLHNGLQLLAWAANDRRLCRASVSKQLASSALARGYSWRPFLTMTPILRAVERVHRSVVACDWPDPLAQSLLAAASAKAGAAAADSKVLALLPL